MKVSQLAKILGRRGGMARARNLSSTKKKEIGRLGGEIRWLSAKAPFRILKNFTYFKAVHMLKKKTAGYGGFEDQFPFTKN